MADNLTESASVVFSTGRREPGGGEFMVDGKGREGDWDETGSAVVVARVSNS